MNVLLFKRGDDREKYPFAAAGHELRDILIFGCNVHGIPSDTGVAGIQERFLGFGFKKSVRRRILS